MPGLPGQRVEVMENKPVKKKRDELIMVVDDDPQVLDFTSTLLDRYGYQTVSFASAEDALESLKKNRVDLVLSDISMPVVTGIELLAKVRDISPETPVILMTGYTDFERVVDALKMRAFDFILKPFKIEHLIHSVEKALVHVRLLRTEENYKHLLEEFNREIETLLAERTMSLLALTIADKIRNPATVIGLISKKMLEGRDDPDRFQDRLRVIVSEAEKLDVIVKQFQSFFKDKKSLFVNEDINTVLQSALSVTRSDAAGKGLELVVALSEQPLNINMEKNLMKVALCHVIRNAIAATPGGGKVTIQTSREMDAAVVEISDTGCGIPAEDLDHVFEPFFSTKAHSFGIGLPLVRQIISEHMGKIGVKSVLEKGTTFRITIPLRWTEKILEATDGAAA
jgi:signal transduction histidine kinase